MTIFDFLDLLGTAAFAISGALFAIKKRMDTFGVLIIAFVTAVGGGTLRDILINADRITWMNDLNYIYVILFSVIFAIIFRKKIGYLSKSLFLFDTIGLGIFTIIGTEIGLQNEFHGVICVSLGMITATFGGVIRDTLSNEIPLIFQKEIYATACIIGATTYLILNNYQIDRDLIHILTTIMVIAVRLIAVRFKLQLPTFYSS
ncbi:trimeric intracellular cation channel family protein [Lutimonas saemankumensis]|uniref:trimeric intracellular cation channel family protein n=1 Tax=Lutimonas saemankumensis TaxID=483016 RepID=UPI001CD5B108|nr:trimeric intracellular cation channel family protein [Lutimonas saemankumensis]MCA0931965.1 trimeric intracellular cation channel family protein [Lutimonas saemankumensis]